MSRSRYDHLHVYVRVVDGGNLYRCSKEECHHTISKHLLLGRAALCPACNEKFIVKEKHLKNKRVHCIECKKIKKLAETIKDKGLNIENHMIEKMREDVLSGLKETFKEER